MTLTMLGIDEEERQSCVQTDKIGTPVEKGATTQDVDTDSPLLPQLCHLEQILSFSWDLNVGNTVAMTLC